jgi:putative restriction endonuclease
MVRIYIGNTDNTWFDFLSSLGVADEVNFWQPSSRNFNAIGEGERFAFRLKSPRNAIGGFGTLAQTSRLPIQMAWETFGVKNGVPSLDQFVQAIGKYRTQEVVTPSTFIVCRVLVEPIFLPPSLWFPAPSWSNSIVSGKTFSGDRSDGATLWASLEERGAALDPGPFAGFRDEGAPRYGQPTLVTPRLGQGAFRIAVTEIYGRQCALTDGKVLPALDAAHIRPYGEGGGHFKSNGILLRKDIHSVFDAGYATFDEKYRFVVSEKVRDIFNNGNEYRRLHGKSLRLPASASNRPDKEALRWHNDHRYLG